MRCLGDVVEDTAMEICFIVVEFKLDCIFCHTRHGVLTARLVSNSKMNSPEFLNHLTVLSPFEIDRTSSGRITSGEKKDTVTVHDRAMSSEVDHEKLHRPTRLGYVSSSLSA